MLASLRIKGIKMYSISRKILRSLSSACPLCGLGARGGDLCVGCADDLSRPLSDPARCERYAPAYLCLVAAIDYAYPGDMLIQRFKEGARLAYAGLFARLLWARLQGRASEHQAIAPVSALVAIPSSQNALKRRGFNPAGELARELARLSGLPVQHTWLIRTRETNTQKTLNARARRESVSGLYVCPIALPGVWVGLVDDVVTTGSTMDTAAQALLSAGAAGVVGLAAAHTPRTWQNGAYD